VLSENDTIATFKGSCQDRKANFYQVPFTKFGWTLDAWMNFFWKKIQEISKGFFK
jgi:hypothetical protein